MKSPQNLYRLATGTEWRQAQADGVVPRRAMDIADGYVHLSTRDQALETARLHFAGAMDLLALEIPFAAVADHVRFEAAPKRGEAFPHLYAPLQAGDVARALRLSRDGAGFAFGEALT